MTTPAFTPCAHCAQPAYQGRAHTCYDPHPPALRAVPGLPEAGKVRRQRKNRKENGK